MPLSSWIVRFVHLKIYWKKYLTRKFEEISICVWIWRIFEMRTVTIDVFVNTAAARSELCCLMSNQWNIFFVCIASRRWLKTVFSINSMGHLVFICCGIKLWFIGEAALEQGENRRCVRVSAWQATWGCGRCCPTSLLCCIGGTLPLILVRAA